MLLSKEVVGCVGRGYGGEFKHTQTNVGASLLAMAA